MRKDESIFVAGHRGLVGSALVRLLTAEGFKNLITVDRSELDLRNEVAVRSFFREKKPTYVILAAARVGGIQANIDAPYEFLLENLQIQNNVISAAAESAVAKFCFLGSSCIYPTNCPQPMREEFILSGPLEPTNEGYALAKLSGMKLVQYLARQQRLRGINPLPCNLYGPNDSFDLRKSHVLSALVRRFSDAKRQGVSEVSLWGTGVARREFMHVDDLARAVVHLMKNYDSAEPINVGWGEDVSIKELAEMVAGLVGYQGRISWSPEKPDGMLRKCLDVSRLSQTGFQAQISLVEGIQGMITEYESRRTKGEFL